MAHALLRLRRRLGERLPQLVGQEIRIIPEAAPATRLPQNDPGRLPPVHELRNIFAAVATDVGGNKELVRHESTGLLVPPGDAGAMAAAIGRLPQADREAVLFKTVGCAAWDLAAARVALATMDAEGFNDG